MDISQVIVESHFVLKANREDLEALKLCLYETYHNKHKNIPKRLTGIVSRLMDTIDGAIEKDNEIQRKVAGN